MNKIAILLALCGAACAQDASSRITVPFSDPSRPRTVTAHMINSCFTVEGYAGREVTIESLNGHPERAERRESRAPRGAEGLHRIEPTGMGLTVEEENNVISIHGIPSRGGDLLIRVPVATSLKLERTNGGEMKVSHVTGDLELSNLNGRVTATNVSGSVVAHSLNGQVVVSMDQIAPNKPMSFSTMNGSIDVTLPSEARGTVHMRSDNGEMYSDFDIKLSANASAPVVEDGRSKGGKYRVKVDRSTVGTINGGGPDLNFKTFNGSIFLRKKK